MEDHESYGNFILIDEVGLSKLEEKVLHESALLIAKEISKRMIQAEKEYEVARNIRR